MSRFLRPLPLQGIDLADVLAIDAPVSGEGPPLPRVPVDDRIRHDTREWSRRGLVAHDRIHPASAAIDILRTKALQRMQQQGWRTIGVTAPTVGHGKSLLAGNLALSLARRTDLAALLVDLDWRRPALARLFGIDRGVSLNEVIAGTGALDRALLRLGEYRLSVLPCMEPMTDAAERLAGSQTAALIAELRDRYTDRIVVFDLPPLLDADDALAVVEAMDCVLLVVDDGGTRRRELLEAVRHVRPDRLLGTALMSGVSARQERSATRFSLSRSRR